MKGVYLALLFFVTITWGACCSKKGACPSIKFESFELVNFEWNDINDSVYLIRYDGNSNFLSVLDTTVMKAEYTDDPKVFKLPTQEMGVDKDYAIRVAKLNKLYKINNFTGEKIACGKCFMRPNNQFGYQLNGYSVNSRHQSYEGIVRVIK